MYMAGPFSGWVVAEVLSVGGLGGEGDGDGVGGAAGGDGEGDGGAGAWSLSWCVVRGLSGGLGEQRR
jgi:hypothetical protein